MAEANGGFLAAPSATDFRPIFFFVGTLLLVLGLAMTLPMLADAVVGHPDWQAFLTASVVTLFVGVSLILMHRQTAPSALTNRQAFLLTTLVWLAAAAFGALPFTLSALQLSYTDAFFEAMSGITTTGSTVIAGLDTLPPGILLWRAVLQWFGGIGFVVLGITALPALQIGGMQLFQTEFSDR
jgi:trk system potassium uptake protein